MKQQQAFTNAGKMLKGGLHCHTTRSDGAGDPATVIRYHKEHGYDFLALTDHRVYNFINYAPETGVTILPAMEFDNDLPNPYGLRTFHTVCIGPEKENGNGYNQDERFDSGREPDQEHFQATLDRIHANKNLTIYCHPEWSGTPARYFDKLEGNFAMEIWNSGCVIADDMDKDAAYWDEILGQGKKIYGVATDDGHAMSDHCNGWVMVNAENTVDSILAALKDGKFYSSCGPEIYNFYVDGDRVVIDCSPVSMVRLQSDGHPTVLRTDAEGKITHAEFPLNGWPGPFLYVRISIVDKDGKKAWTNPIFLED